MRTRLVAAPGVDQRVEQQDSQPRFVVARQSVAQRRDALVVAIEHLERLRERAVGGAAAFAELLDTPPQPRESVVLAADGAQRVEVLQRQRLVVRVEARCDPPAQKGHFLRGRIGSEQRRLRRPCARQPGQRTHHPPRDPRRERVVGRARRARLDEVDVQRRVDVLVDDPLVQPAAHLSHLAGLGELADQRRTDVGVRRMRGEQATRRGERILRSPDVVGQRTVGFDGERIVDRDGHRGAQFERVGEPVFAQRLLQRRDATRVGLRRQLDPVEQRRAVGRQHDDAAIPARGGVALQPRGVVFVRVVDARLANDQQTERRVVADRDLHVRAEREPRREHDRHFAREQRADHVDVEAELAVHEPLIPAPVAREEVRRAVVGDRARDLALVDRSPECGEHRRHRRRHARHVVLTDERHRQLQPRQRRRVTTFDGAQRLGQLAQRPPA